MLNINRILIRPSKTLQTSVGSLVLLVIVALSFVAWSIREYLILSLAAYITLVTACLMYFLRWLSAYRRERYCLSYSSKTGLIFARDMVDQREVIWEEVLLSNSSVIGAYVCFLILTRENNESVQLLLFPDSINGAYWRELIVVMRTIQINSK